MMNKTALLLATTAMTMVTFTVIAARFAYVPNEESGTISVIDVGTDEAVKEIRAGDKPRGLAVSKDGKKLYVSDQPHNSLVVIDWDKLKPFDGFFLDESPEGVVILPDGKGVFAAVESVTPLL